MNAHNSFGSFLTDYRKQLGLTGEQMAKRLGISHAYYNAFETGRRNAPDQELLDKIAEVLCLDSSDRLALYDLAGKTRGTVAPDLPEYINNNPYVRVALRRARDSDAAMEEWLQFIARLDKKKERSK